MDSTVAAGRLKRPKMSDQRCGNCRYYQPVADNSFGYCHWRRGRDVPYCVERAYWWDVYPEQGEQCKTWQAKETPAP